MSTPTLLHILMKSRSLTDHNINFPALRQAMFVCAYIRTRRPSVPEVWECSLTRGRLITPLFFRRWTNGEFGGKLPHLARKAGPSLILLMVPLMICCHCSKKKRVHKTNVTLLFSFEKDLNDLFSFEQTSMRSFLRLDT